jgi:F-type H+-transporting ATPase subunit gamma
MANLKDIRNRIASIGSTMQITSAMKMVSAAKLKKAQKAIVEMRPYSNKLTELIQRLSSSLDIDDGSDYTKQRKPNNVLLVAINSNRGLCGAFNSNIIKHTIELDKTKYASSNVSILTIGKKGFDILSKNYTIFRNESEIYNDLTFERVSVLAQDLMDQFTDGHFDRIILIYNKFKNAANQVLTEEQFLPIVPPAEEEQKETATDFIFEPSEDKIIHELLPKSLKTQLFKALRDSFASEHGARMTAMHKATDNATDLRDELLLQYNKARQSAITNEILEIVGGAEALKG